MTATETFAHATLDTLPMNIAVLDETGTIVFTNRTWEEFSGVEAGAMEGVNYFATTDPDADAYAARAVDGLEAVIEGDRELFTMEYPCHTADEKQWFLMRVAPLPAADRGSAVVAHVDITQRKLAELAAERRSEQLAAERENLQHLVDRVDGLVRAALGDVMTADSRADVQQRICDRLAAVDSYQFAWVATFDIRDESLEPAATSTATDGGFSVPLSDDGPIATAARTGEIQVESTGLDDRHARLAAAPITSLAAVPIVAGESLYGVLTVYADENGVFDPRERTVLGVIGTALSSAIDAIETSRLLTADNLTEIRLRVADDDLFFVTLAAALDCDLEYGGSVVRDDGSSLFFLVETADPSAVCDLAAEHPIVRDVSALETTESLYLFEFAVESPPVVAELAEQGAETRDVVVEPTHATVTATHPATTETRRVVAAVQDAYPGTDLLSVRERERPPASRQDFLATLDDRLTDRQATALRKGYLGGFFDWPRDVSGEELAASMDISPSTFHQHLRAGERKLLAAIFEAG